MIIIHLKHKIHLFDVRLALMDHHLRKDRERERDSSIVSVLRRNKEIDTTEKREGERAAMKVS